MDWSTIISNLIIFSVIAWLVGYFFYSWNVYKKTGKMPSQSKPRSETEKQIEYLWLNDLGFNHNKKDINKE